jgi:hypothetical protein
MEGRYPNGLLLAITTCNDPAKEADFNYWYNHIHVPDVTAPGVFRHAIRFRNTDPEHGGRQYVATYETTWEDIAQARAALQENSAKLREQGGRSCPYLQSVWSGAGVFKRLGGEFQAATNRPARGILAVLLNCRDAAREDEFNRWYSDVHIPDILDTGLFHTAYRYESLDPQITGGKYLALYETDAGDPGKAGEELGKLRANWEQRGRLFDATERVMRLTARRIWPLD